MRIKTIVPKNTYIEQYIGKPVYDEITPNNTETKIIGHIEEVKELEYNYELTINLYSTLQIGWRDKEGSSIEIIGIKQNR